MSSILSSDSNSDTIKWMQAVKLLRTTAPFCAPNHQHVKPVRMRLITSKKHTDGSIFRCSNCGRSKSIRSGSFFSEIKIELIKFMKLLMLWALQLKHVDISKLLKIAPNTITKYCQGIRALIYQDLNWDKLKVSHVSFRSESCSIELNCCSLM
jgi:hypothetical protein